MVEHITVGFYPAFDETEWNKRWVKKVKSYAIKSFKKTSVFIPGSGLPKIFLVSPEFRDVLKRSNGLPEWTKAFTQKDEIYLLFDDKLKEWKNVLNHEMFHARVYSFFDGNIVLPRWLNEAIAYFIGKNSDTDTYKLGKYLEPHFEHILYSILDDTVLNIEFYGYAVIKLLGRYICVKYRKKRVRLFLLELKKGSDFDSAFKKVFEMDLENMVKKWYFDEYGRRS
jgi:hypothetical protein